MKKTAHFALRITIISAFTQLFLSTHYDEKRHMHYHFFLISSTHFMSKSFYALQALFLLKLKNANEQNYIIIGLSVGTPQRLAMTIQLYRV